MLSVITLASKKSPITHYTTALSASKKENYTNYRFEMVCACAVIVTLQSAQTTLLPWHYFWREEIGSDTLHYVEFTDTLDIMTNSVELADDPVMDTG